MTTEITPAPFGQSLRRLREAAGLSRFQLAVKSGVSIHVINHTERGRYTPQLGSAVALARAVGGTVEEMFGETKGGAA